MRKITTYSKEFLIMALLFLIEVSAIIRANMYFCDDLGRNIAGYTGNDYDSRYIADWISIIVGGNTYNTDVSPLTQILACIVLGITVVVVAYVFTGGGNFTLMHYVCGTIVMSPFFLTNMSYKYDSVFMAISILVSVLPFIWKEKKAVFLISSIVCLLAMCMTYQASSGIYPMMAIMLAFLEWNKGEKKFKESVLFVLYAAATYLITLAFYGFFLMKPLEANYVDITLLSMDNFITGIFANYKKFYKFTNYAFMTSWKIMILLLLLIFGVLFVIKSARNKVLSAGMFFAMMVMLGVVAFGVYPAFSVPLIEPRSNYGFSFFLMICGFGILSFKSRIVWGGKAVILALSWGLFAFSFTYGNALAQEMKYADFRIQEVVDDLADLDIMLTDDEKNMVIEGEIGYSPAVANYPLDYKFIQAMVPRYFMQADDYWGDVYFFYYFKLPNVNNADTEYDESEFTVAHENIYHKILTRGNDIIVKLK